MKLKFVSSLNEANIDRGRRLLKLEKINDSIQSAVEGAGYSFKGLGDKGFYILPKNKFIVKIDIDIIEAENAYNVKIFDACAHQIPELSKKVTAQNFVKSMTDEIIPSALTSVFHITTEDQNKLKSNDIKEALPNVFKNIIGGIAAAADKHAAVKADKKLLDNFVKECDQIAKDVVSSFPGGTRNIKVKTETNGDRIEIYFYSDVIVGVGYRTDSAVGDARMLISSCITSFKEHKGLVWSLASFILFLNRKLSLHIKIEDASLLSFTGSDEAEIKKAGSFEASIKDDVGDEILSKLNEDLNILNEKFTDTKKYDEALSLVKNDVQGQGLVKLYFFRESSTAKDESRRIKLTDVDAKKVYQAVKSAGTFRCPLVNLITKYFAKNNKSLNIVKELQNLIAIVTEGEFIEKIDISDNTSLIYNPIFVSNKVTALVAQGIYNKHTNVKKGKKDLTPEAIGALVNTIRNELQIRKPDTNLTTSADLADYMVIEKGAVRDEQKIKDIYSIAITGKSTKANTDDSEERQDTYAFDSANPELLNDIAKIITDAVTNNGVAAPSEIVAAMRNNKNKKSIAKVLAQLATKIR